MRSPTSVPPRLATNATFVRSNGFLVEETHLSPDLPLQVSPSYERADSGRAGAVGRASCRDRADLSPPAWRAYGLTRDTLRYILDPADVNGPDHPSETFRVLKKNEIDCYGEYRTTRLVLAAWDEQEARLVAAK
jgi:hypothetical protein